jgi:two-component system, OmpR family, sensor histidine kinase BaeS
MHQVITNLLSNAAKFTPAGGRVVVTTGRSGDRCLVSVSDNGVGIPADQLPHIFERFWRGVNPTGAAGSGVGLAVVAELIRGHGGQIDVQSTPGEGTEFLVYLPMA